MAMDIFGGLADLFNALDGAHRTDGRDVVDVGRERDGMLADIDVDVAPSTDFDLALCVDNTGPLDQLRDISHGIISRLDTVS